MDSHHAQRKSPRRGAYLLPSLFTVANIFFGFSALTECFSAAQFLPENLAAAAPHFDIAAKAIGWAVLADGFDGRIARLMGTSSEFGKEFDSIADAITFGLAPAFLAVTWGVRSLVPLHSSSLMEHLGAAGWLVSFLWVICAAARLARFNIAAPAPASGARPDKKHFAGLPSPAAAGLVAAIIHFNLGQPVGDWAWVPFWLVVLLGVSLLMVSTLRYYSFKDVDWRRKRKFPVVIFVAGIIASIWFYSQVALLLIASTYVLSGVVLKLTNLIKRPRVVAPVKQRNV